MELRRRHVHSDPRFHAIRTVTAAALALFLVALPCAAQTSVEVSPLRIELQSAPGGSTTQAITLSNTGNAPVRVRATLSDWDLSRTGSPEFLDASDSRYSASAWIRIAPPEQVIDAGKEATVRFTLTIPANADPAGYRSSILFEFHPAGNASVARGRGIAVVSRIGTLIYANVGQPPAAVDLTDLQTRALPEQPVQIVAVLKNTSRRTVRTKGTLTVYDQSGAAVSQSSVPDVPVLPESEREVAIPAINPDKPSLPAGDYRVEIKIDVGLPALIVGETTLKVS
jgi:P pilus assembly chaperone PapD